ncbi:uncharacterized protein [Eurosta solidaginis]|uniref:uncharacterized protein n=1 Tax=Eurosta solidaginis TaxID=178769 RepID=UPI0035314017
MKLSTIFFIALTITFAVATVRAEEVVGEQKVAIDDGPSEASNTEVLQTNTETSDAGIWEDLYNLIIAIGTNVEYLFGWPVKMVLEYGHISVDKEDKPELNSTTDDENNIQAAQEMPHQDTSIESSENKIQPVQEMAIESPPVQELPVDGTNTKFLDALRKVDNEEKPKQDN